jgi:hypothetical protein
VAILSSDSIGLLFRARGDTDDARSAFKKLRNDVESDVNAIKGSGTSGFGQLTQVIGGTETAMGGLTSAAGPVAIGLGVITAAAAGTVAVLTKLFGLSVDASDFGSAIFDAQQKTGLSADALQALKYAADESGSSFEAITGTVAKFNVLLGEANAGNEKARATLEKYGITATDTDGALKQAITTIAEMTSVDQQAAAAKALFKDRTAEILPVIKSFDGDLPGLIDKLREMGVLIGEENVAASDKFGDTLDDLRLQLSSIARTIGFEVLPIFLTLAQNISSWLAENKEAIATWAHYIKVYLDGVITAWQIYAKVARVGLALARGDVIGAGVEATSPLTTPGKGFAGAGGRASTGGTGPAPSGGGGKGGGRSSAQAEEERRAKADLQAQIAIEKDKIKVAETEYKELLDNLRKEFTDTGNATAFLNKASDGLTKYRESLEQILPALTEFENLQASGQTVNQLEQLRRQQEERVTELQKKMNESVTGNNKLITDSATDQAKKILQIHQKLESDVDAVEKRRTDRQIQSTIDWYEAEIAAGNQVKLNTFGLINFLNQIYDAEYQKRIEEIGRERDARVKDAETQIKNETERRRAVKAINDYYDQLELDAKEQLESKKKEITDRYTLEAATGTEGGASARGSIFDEWSESWMRFFDIVQGTAPTLADTLSNVLGTSANFLEKAFQGVANAVGSLVQNWVLYGKTGPAVMRMILAQALASIAAEAAVRAIFELAAGFASLFFNPAEAAAHFTAAALYGTIAVGAALAGRAVAGNAFNKQNQGGYGGAPSQAQQTQRNVAGQGTVYSSQKDAVVDISRNAPGEAQALGTVQFEMSLKEKPGWVEELVIKGIRNNGPLRAAVKEAA